MHDPGIIILIFITGSLLLGSLLKVFLSKSKMPYTVLLLMVGLGLASMVRAGWLGGGMIDSMLHLVGSIEPHFILFLFLPILIFESAFSMEPHLFFRIAPQIILLAIIGLIISMVLSAVVVSWLFPWSMGVALLFGALISATDPVAVVALLKEKSSRKRLETLVEGESLLNDGTAIVFFSLFYGFALGTTAKVEPLTVIGEFFWVALGGLAVGGLIGWVVLRLIGKLFNQPLVEITLSIAAAYVTFIVAEEFHLSGVIALVALALMFSTVGRTKISPEVSHYLHQFWHMMSHIANTLIFLIVGIVIALHISLDSPRLWLILPVLYLALTIIRTLSVWSLMPILKRIGVGITREKATVLVWGGLRGAVSLSLALALAQDEAIAAPLRNQILFLTAGIVVLTIVINGSSMEWLLHLLKLDKLPPAKEASVQRAYQTITARMEEFSRSILNDPFFKAVDLKELTRVINDQANNEAPEQPALDVAREEIDFAFMRRLLEIERSDYWRQFDEGYVGRQAVFELSRSVEHALDQRPLISPRPTLQSVFTVPTPPDLMHKLPVLGNSWEDWLMSRLSLSYDIARGFVAAQEEMRSHIAGLSPDQETGQRIEDMIDRNCTEAFSFIQHISEKHPLLISQLQSLSAKRMLLNHQRSLIWKMQHDGVLQETEAQHLIDTIESKMIKIRQEGQDKGSD